MNVRSKRTLKKIRKGVWYKQYVKLVAYHRKHGDCKLPPGHRLSGWASNQRSSMWRKQLTEAKQSLLARIGFDFTVQRALPNQPCAAQDTEQLKDFFSQLGLPSDFPIALCRLNSRCLNYCTANNCKTLGEFVALIGNRTVAEMQEADQVGIASALILDKFLNSLSTGDLNELVKYLPINPSTGRLSLAAAFSSITPESQRLAMLQNRLCQQLTLDASGKPFGVTREYVRLIETRFINAVAARLAWFTDDSKRLLSDWEQGKDLGGMLEAMGLTSHPTLFGQAVSRVFGGDSYWENLHIPLAIALLEACKAENNQGGIDLPLFLGKQSQAKSEPRFRAWLRNNLPGVFEESGSLLLRTTQQLTSTQHNLLFKVRYRDSVWDVQFNNLKAFYEKACHCNVPIPWEGSRRLAAWVYFQRLSAARGKLLAGRKEKLDGLGFSWLSRRRNSWDVRFKQILAYRKQHGDCNIPTTLNKPHGLGACVNSLRARRMRDELTPERIAQLDGIGFLWEAVPRVHRIHPSWAKKLEQLTIFLRENSHSAVKVKPPSTLRTWISIQKSRHRKGKLSPRKIQLLKDAGLDLA